MSDSIDTIGLVRWYERIKLREIRALPDYPGPDYSINPPYPDINDTPLGRKLNLLIRVQSKLDEHANR